jgi:hypothetical protein
MNPPQPPITVQSGMLVALRLFDLSYAIDLGQAEALWASHLGSASRRSPLTAAPQKAVAFEVPPLLLDLEPIMLDIEGVKVLATMRVRLYDFGVAAFSISIPVVNLPWTEFSDRLNALDKEVGPGSASKIWRTSLAALIRILGSSIDRLSESMIEEDYLMGIVHSLSEELDASELCLRADIAGLLSGTTRALSVDARTDLLKRRFSYYADDLAILTWDRAFLYEPNGDSDVANILEVANAQLVEFRYYDELLDRELPPMYDRVEHAHRAGSFLSSRRFAHLARKLHTLVAEVTELAAKADKVLQVTEDVYLARVYAAALEQFRVPKVSAAVDRKLSIIRDTYAALYDEASVRRTELLEVAIVVLIVIEILLAAFH